MNQRLDIRILGRQTTGAVVALLILVSLAMSCRGSGRSRPALIETGEAVVIARRMEKNLMLLHYVGEDFDDVAAGRLRSIPGGDVAAYARLLQNWLWFITEDMKRLERTLEPHVERYLKEQTSQEEFASEAVAYAIRSSEDCIKLKWLRLALDTPGIESDPITLAEAHAEMASLKSGSGDVEGARHHFVAVLQMLNDDEYLMNYTYLLFFLKRIIKDSEFSGHDLVTEEIRENGEWADILAAIRSIDVDEYEDLYAEERNVPEEDLPTIGDAVMYRRSLLEAGNRP